MVHAFKVTVDTNKPLFQTIKEDPKSRITDLPLTPDAILPGSTSGFDLWREDEDRRRVKTIVGAFAERPKLPKMLRRKDLLDTVSNGCVQGLYVLSLPRPDGSARTWWRMPIDETALTDDAIEAVQNSAAVLDSLDPALLAPGKLEGLDWKNGLKVADLVAYFDGHTLTIDHPDEGWTEEKPIPRCPEAKVLEAVSASVKASNIWITSGAASVWGDTPQAECTARMRHTPPVVKVQLHQGATGGGLGMRAWWWVRLHLVAAFWLAVSLKDAEANIFRAATSLFEAGYSGWMVLLIVVGLVVVVAGPLVTLLMWWETANKDRPKASPEPKLHVFIKALFLMLALATLLEMCSRPRPGGSGYGDENGLAVIDGSLRRRAGRLVVAAGLVGRAAAAEAHDPGGQPGEDGLDAHDLFDAGNQFLESQPPANGFRGLGPLGLQHGPYTNPPPAPSAAAAAAPSRAAGRTPTV